MAGRFFTGCLLIMLLTMLYVRAAGAEERRVLRNPHDYNIKSLCALCHTAKPPELSFDPVSTCAKCHEGYVANHPVAGHPMGKVPESGVSTVMYLSADGKMVCHTCHDQHNMLWRENMLRVPYIKLCASCHKGY
jgi:predicted CXXCH cytochrome family protein